MIVELPDLQRALNNAQPIHETQELQQLFVDLITERNQLAAALNEVSGFHVKVCHEKQELQKQLNDCAAAIAIATRAVELTSQLARAKPDPMTVFALRDRFETIFSAPPFEFEMDKYNSAAAWPGSYRQYHIQCAWDGFQEGAKL